jgi:hypothetical protein
VRRIDERHQLPTFSTEETTTYDPVINGEIGEEILAFAPPGVSKASEKRF